MKGGGIIAWLAVGVVCLAGCADTATAPAAPANEAAAPPQPEQVITLDDLPGKPDNLKPGDKVIVKVKNPDTKEFTEHVFVVPGTATPVQPE